ncbi:PaaX domain-containing protein, C- domain protein [Gordonia sp. VNK21]|uniref:PaaX domain-containing protein, C- domain protein n=1 Tax=Gordonia sp. VNK21 TaxID=3382483 RepID=UPI0038D3D9F8
MTDDRLPADVFRQGSLSARSVALNLLLGAPAAGLAGRDLVRLGKQFGVAGSTMRVALSRMASAGELESGEGVYRLSERHRRRQARQDAQVSPSVRAYGGFWVQGIVVTAGRAASEREELRRDMRGARFGELREGVWMRPDNLGDLVRPDRPELEYFRVVPDEPKRLCDQLWDVQRWAERADDLIGALRSSAAEPVVRLSAAAAAVRHLCTDPVLPPELVPQAWPADQLRIAYEDFRESLASSLVSPERSEPDNR